MRFFRYLWAFPATAIGLLFATAALLTGGSLRLSNGVIEACGGIVGRWLRGGRFHRGGAAVTFGHVILARDRPSLERSRFHEMGHVRQFERWGPLLLPMYWSIALWLWLRGYDPYLDHPFEPPPREPDPSL
ncbi:MAG TPA: hypothetical protein VHB77_08080 [Planctomycetaceae bacterium]|nr:hypothetical protein [Planctomycetaceae bacterium]